MDARFRCAALCVATLGMAVVPSLDAATTTGLVNVSVALSARAKLTIGSSTISFANADPDTTPTIPASEGPISVTASAITSTSSTVRLTIVAADDLKTPLGVIIPITSVSWAASGLGFQSGTLSRTTAQTVGSWTGSGSRSGTQTYGLANSWSYPTGAYTTSATYTLTAP